MTMADTRRVAFLNTSATVDRELASTYLLSKQQKTLVYAPEVRAYIATSDGKTLDITKDIVSLNLNRVVNSVSNFTAQVANYQNRYKGLIGRMDRVVIFMKRIKWQQVFAGYITSLPVLQIYPGPMTITGECTLKRLIHTYWDPGLKASVELLNSGLPLAGQDYATQKSREDSEESSEGSSEGASNKPNEVPDEPIKPWTWEGESEKDQNAKDAVDAGATKILTRLLTEVANWKKDQIHIQSLPRKLQELLTEQWSGNADGKWDEAAEEYLTYLFGTGQASGEPVLGDGSGSATDVDAFLYALRMVESSNNYKARSSISSASGAYQYISSTWANYQGYAQAYMAPPHVQDARAKKDVLEQYNKYQDWEKVAANHLYPALANDKSRWGTRPGKGNPTIREYVNRVMKHFKAKGGGSVNSTPDSGVAADPVPEAPSGSSGSSGGSVSGSEKAIAPLNPMPKPNSPFGMRTHPISGKRKLHAGVDLPKPGGTPILASLSGTVQFAGNRGGYGKYTILDHGNGLTTCYAHQSKILVQKGQSVRQGDKIGLVGTTGASTGNHLHFEWRVNGKPEDPMPKLGQSVNVEGGGAGVGDGAGVASSGDENPIGRLFNFLGTWKVPAKASQLLKDEKARLNDEPLISTIQTVAKSSMRSFMSAPNGDFVAFYPDYFGHYGSKATLTLDQVEMKDVFIQASDREITTHVYTAGLIRELQQFDLTTWLRSAGVVTIEQDYIFEKLMALTDERGEKITAESFLERFGARPVTAQYPQIRTHEFEYFLAVQLFLQKWAAQYSTNVDLTFMPELYPGMRIVLQGLDIAVYVEAVTHNCSYTNGFTTTATISSPSALGNNTTKIGLPKGVTND